MRCRTEREPQGTGSETWSARVAAKS